MKTYKNGGKTTQQDQSFWTKAHGKLMAAKQKAGAKFVEYTTGNDRKINLSAVKSVAYGTGVVLGMAANSYGMAHSEAMAWGGVALAVGCAAKTLKHGLYVREFQNESRLIKDIKTGFKNSGEKISAAYKKIINSHLNKKSGALNTIMQSRKARTQG